MKKKGMNLSLKSAGFLFCSFLIVFFMSYPAAVFSSETRLTLREQVSGNSSVQVEVGDTVAVEVYISVDTVRSQGVSFYVTFNDSVFSLVDQAAQGDTSVRPFDFTDGKFDDRWNENDTHNDPGNGIDGFQLDGSIVNSVGSRTGEGVVAVFQLVALREAAGSPVTLDYVLGEHRDTRLHIVEGAQSVQFKELVAISITVGTVSGVSEPASSVPGEFMLMQNYPNPFNPQTKITYSLRTPAAAKLQIFSTNGQLVRTLFNERSESTGEHSVIWDGRDDAGIPVASGAYIYRLSVGTEYQSRKMLLVR